MKLQHWKEDRISSIIWPLPPAHFMKGFIIYNIYSKYILYVLLTDDDFLIKLEPYVPILPDAYSEFTIAEHMLTNIEYKFWFYIRYNIFANFSCLGDLLEI